jgi:hypothetical protein
MEDGLDQYQPEDSQNFGTWVRARIGLAGETGADFFDIFVCTPGWLKSQCAEKRQMWMRCLLIVDEYDFQKLRMFIANHVSRYEGDDWVSIAKKLSHIGEWEFDDYQN